MQQVAVETNFLSDPTINLDQRRQKLERIGQLLNESLKKGEEKVALAKSTYDTVDRHCTRLDTDLQKIEDEQLVSPGRVSQKPSKIINNTLKQSEPIESPKRKRMKKDKQQQDTPLSKQDVIDYAKT